MVIVGMVTCPRGTCGTVCCDVLRRKAARHRAASQRIWCDPVNDLDLNAVAFGRLLHFDKNKVSVSL